MVTTPTLWTGLTQVNATDGGLKQSNGQITALANGGYIVTWTSEGMSSYSIFAQTYDALGNKVGLEKN